MLNKARTLKKLSSKLERAYVLDICIASQPFDKEEKKKVKRFLSELGGKVIIRSSASCEDGFCESFAGHFKTVSNVSSDDTVKVFRAVEEVFDSYGNLTDGEEVLIQPMLEDVKACGVAFSCDVSTGAPYINISYTTSGDTEGITSGSTNDLSAFVHFRNSPNPVEDPIAAKVVELLFECERLMGSEFLDIEFAVDSKGELCLFQARPMTVKKGTSGEYFSKLLLKLYKKIEKISSENIAVLSDKAVYSVMSDWNPAEMIGLRPKRLAYSLYKELITDNIWASQRFQYGYRDLRMFPLMFSFLGIPYIDIRASVNSFIPADLDESIASKLADYYLEQLNEAPALHDKLEFDVVFSCYYFGLSSDLSKLKDYGFDDTELNKIEKSLVSLTNNLINPQSGYLEEDIRKIEELSCVYDKLAAQDMSLIDRVYWLSVYVKNFGTLPFAGIARCGFVAMQFLNSMLTEDILKADEYKVFMSSISTVAKEMQSDLRSMAKENFLDKYGHLRPGTYDILSPSYRSSYEKYFSGSGAFDDIKEELLIDDKTRKVLEKKLNDYGLDISVDNLFDFIRKSIKQREYAKFEFSKYISELLECVAQLGVRHSISREDMAHLDITTVIRLYSCLDSMNVKDLFTQEIERNKEMYEYTSMINLPHILTSPDQVYSFKMTKDQPNFITKLSCRSDVVREDELLNSDISGKIVCIRSADPGFDFVFAKGIVGLVTMFGGVNSHMAIRCSELSIPAVIGAGEELFNKIYEMESVSIDCLNQTITDGDCL